MVNCVVTEDTRAVKPFRREGQSWKVDFDLEAPDRANEILGQMVQEANALKAIQAHGLRGGIKL